MNWLGENPWLAWVGLALVLAAIEAASVDFTFVMLSGGALAAAIAAASGAPFPVQVVVAVVVALVLVLLVRPIVRRRFMDTETHQGIGAPSLVGRAARVIEPVSDIDGRVQLAGETWSARVAVGEPTYPVGSELRVLAIEGATAIVTGVAAPDRS